MDKRYWLIGGVSGAVLALAGTRMVWNTAVKAQTPKRIPVERKPAMPYQDIEFVSDGLRIQGWFIPSKIQEDQQHPTDHNTIKDPTAHMNSTTSAPLMIIAHGWGSNRSRVLRYIEPLWEAGYALLMYDARSHGHSEPIEAPSAYTFRDDILAALDYAVHIPEIDPQRIGVLGHSMGGLGTILSLPYGLPVRAVITDSMPAQFESVLEAEFKRRGLPLFPMANIIPRIWFYRSHISLKEYQQKNTVFSINEARKEADLPILMIHSRGDAFIPPTELEFVMGQVTPPIETLFVDTNGHSSSQKDPHFWAKVLPFLDEHVKHAQPRTKAITQSPIVNKTTAKKMNIRVWKSPISWLKSVNEKASATDN
ncbi:alpha/beta hydrolase [Paenibacillus nuruki]|uniref:alpha/beta hydrolase n=1 Tax=Paenibacillus nuruki TaxID=1886670 RepID=UPI0028048FCA|nr:alpha/beta fold hydrolase [Paenibacillus nuruki]CAJ1313359.1 Hydrolase-4 domain-containing protein [Paenibacillus nuruki]